MDEYIYFDTEEAFILYLKFKENLFDEEISNIFSHEKSHFEKAKKLGYAPVYGINTKKIDDKIECVVGVLNEDVSSQDLKSIAIASSNPSEKDLYIKDNL